jgi:hypothetical protein
MVSDDEFLSKCIDKSQVLSLELCVFLFIADISWNLFSAPPNVLQPPQPCPNEGALLSACPAQDNDSR